MRPIDQNAMDAILRYVNDYYRENHTSPTIRQISEATGVSKSKTQRYVVDMKERGIFEYNRGISSAPKSAKVKTSYISAPIVGSIQCGCPEQEEELVEEYVSLPVSIFGKGDYYILRAKGDSMVDAGIEEDDLIVVERNCDVSEGDIVVALDDCGENTLKRFGGYDPEEECFLLQYENEAVYPGKVIKVPSFEVQGVACHVIKSLKRRWPSYDNRRCNLPRLQCSQSQPQPGRNRRLDGMHFMRCSCSSNSSGRKLSFCLCPRPM